VPGSQLGLFDDARQSPVHRPAPLGGRIGVNRPGEYRVGEPEPIAVDLDDSATLCVLELRDNAIEIRFERTSNHSDRRGGQTGHGEQRVADVRGASADLRADQVSETVGQ
jgi:hypothetical protein